ncbi:MAG: hypothetical protein ACT4OZ_11255 [Gemmatimonadota bacterium]
MNEQAAVAELRELIDSYQGLTCVALQACLRRDDETLHSLLDAREVVTSRVGAITGAIERGRSRGLSLRLTPIHAALARLGELDRELNIAATTWRDETGDELRKLGREERAVAAYGVPRTAEGRATVDFTR